MALTAKQKRDAALAAGGETAKAIVAETVKLNEKSGTHPDQVADAHGEIAKPQSAGAKVIVGCKLGIAYLDIQLCKKEPVFEQNMQGGRMVDAWKRDGKVVRLRGTAYPRGTPPEGFPPPPEIVAGAALNYGIDKDWFDEWLAQNKRNPIVMNHMVFAHATVDGARAEARELAGVLSGLDPVNPKGDARIPKSTRGEVSDVETEETRAKASA